MKSYIIHLVRHGMTEGNKTGQYVGSMDVDITTEGINQLKELKEKYDYGNPQVIYRSPLKRCKQTTDILYDNADTVVVEGLRECNFGDFEGKTSEELVDDPRFNDWVRHGATPPNGESNKEFAERICIAFINTIKEILKSGVKETAICAHGGVIMTLLSVYGLPEQEMINWMANNGRGFTIRVTPSIWMRTGMVEVIGEYPPGSYDEPDLSRNPVKELNNNEDSNPFGTGEEEYDSYEDTEYFWADVEEKENSEDKE